MDNSHIKLSRLKRKVLSHVKIVRIVILATIITLVLLVSVFTYRIVSKSIIGTGIGMMRDFSFPSTNRIVTNNGNINILLMGKGGVGHDAPDLTDTMILVSVSTTNKKITLVSLPRDIWMNDLKDKINSAYMYGGVVLAKSTVEEVTGVQIDYGVVVDFGVFKNIIDTLGGIQVDVKNGFTDNLYPIAGKENDNCNNDKTYACRYETITFQPGIQTMDGETALKFVRSRHADGVEGNDIAREGRQQLVIYAIFQKATSQVFTNFSVDRDLLNIVQNNIQTDLKPSEEATLMRYVFDAKGNIKSYTIPDELLYNPPDEYKYFNKVFTRASVFVPNNKQSINGKDEDWSDIQKWVQTVLP